eukprot:2130821-Amphidinium_carterae.1
MPCDNVGWRAFPRVAEFHDFGVMDLAKCHCALLPEHDETKLNYETLFTPGSTLPAEGLTLSVKATKIFSPLETGHIFWHKPKAASVPGTLLFRSRCSYFALASLCAYSVTFSQSRAP